MEKKKSKYQKHGLSETPTYKVWHHMMRSCYNDKSYGYFLNGARGIKVCKRWHSMQNFQADMGSRPDDHYLKRVDKRLDYSLENCKWQKKNISMLHDPVILPVKNRSLWQHIKEWWVGK